MEKIELHRRIQVRIMKAEKAMKKPVNETSCRLVCAGCGLTRIASDQWGRLTDVPAQSKMTDISHGLCPSCIAIHYPEIY